MTGSESPERIKVQPVKTPACWRFQGCGVSAEGSSSGAGELAWRYEMSSMNDRQTWRGRAADVRWRSEDPR